MSISLDKLITHCIAIAIAIEVDPHTYMLSDSIKASIFELLLPADYKSFHLYLGIGLPERED